MNENNKIYYVCPFCGENDFDLIGLKFHLIMHCEKYEKINHFDALPKGANKEK